MTEIDFSLIGQPSLTLQHLLAKFQDEQKIEVKLRVIEWENAWHDLLMWALYEQGPDISHVGSTWASSLVALNALRSFSENEIKEAGGQMAFLQPAWQSGKTTGSLAIWSMPWHTYTFLIAYRRDLLEKAGVDESIAFTTADEVNKTMQKLRVGGIQYPWVLPIGEHHLDTLHYLASWVWGSGGDFITPDGHHTAFTESKTFKAIETFFELLRYMQPVDLPLNEMDALAVFTGDKAAATIVGAGIAYEWLRNQEISPDILDHIGFAPVPGVPWIGGDNLVIWRHTRADPDREKAAIALTEYLLSQPVQKANAQSEDVGIPSRTDSLNALPLPNSQLTKIVTRSLRAGRAYRSLTSWSKIEHQFAQSLGKTGAEILNGADPSATCLKNLNTFANWLEISLR
jgi:multiple sugar transport system substrate-binding protein